MASERPYCIQCGAQLEPSHNYCWSCGAPRWTPAGPEGAPPPSSQVGGESAPPVPGTAATQRRQPVPSINLGLLPWLYAAGAVFFLVWATQALALFVSSVGRTQLFTEMSRQGVPKSAQPTVLLVYAALLIGAALAAAALHGAAFYGLRRRRRWGWLSAVVVAGLWSLLIVGVPVLLKLINRNVRQAFGVD